jgi:hypothetical protein
MTKTIISRGTMTTTGVAATAKRGALSRSDLRNRSRKSGIQKMTALKITQSSGRVDDATD